ncbi:MAG: YgiQ family radical SAM protein [Candidatus Margulisbacteria bacterium]|nr:YgiQ family radical SAM protein [Candidatus Margulisiibacteriota bacterium]
MSFDFLPTNRQEMAEKSWESVDIIIISGDAYIDHPSFGPALIGRFLEANGFKVAIIPQPDWHKDEDFFVCGKPNLFFGITAGNMDSMIANYSSEKHRRKEDEYSEKGEAGKRPDRAVIVYSNMIKKLFPGTPIIVGGIEASLRRLTHYDYWSDNIRRSILFDSRADLLVYGMAEKAITEAAHRLRHLQTLRGIKNTAYIADPDYYAHQDHVELPAHEDILNDSVLLLKATINYERECAKRYPQTIIQRCQGKAIIIEPPDALSSDELDNIYELPFIRQAHPRYKHPVPAFGFVKNSVVSHRGCYGGCSFCTLNMHQGKYIISRSYGSIINEIKNVIMKQPDFTGHILDIGGPSANMYGHTCISNQGCTRVSCVYPVICPNMNMDFQKQLKLLDDIRRLPGIKNVFINSGIRYDLALQNNKYIEQLARYHVSGQLSIAPEHCSEKVLKIMHKPSFGKYLDFLKQFETANKRYNKEQYVIPYFIASHPGCTLNDMYELALYMKKNNLRVKQVQNFIPIPMTLSAAMYYSERDPETSKHIHVAKGEERLWQRALLQPWLKINQKNVSKALQKIGKKL